MTDLTYCYLHMTDYEIECLDDIDTDDFIDNHLSDEELEIPPHMIPPNPDDADTLPSEVHPSYPYGNPTSLGHPSTLPRTPYDAVSRALFEDQSREGAANPTFALRWKELALDTLLPKDQDIEEAKRAAEARRITTTSQPQNAQGQNGELTQPTVTEDDENDENEGNNEDGTLQYEDDE